MTTRTISPEPGKAFKMPAKYASPSVDHLPMLDESAFPNDVLHRTLFKALTMKRPYASFAEADFVGWLVNRLPVRSIDSAGNVHVDIRKTDQHRTMFTSHTDTVHRHGGVNKVRVDTNAQRVMLRADGDALGADDGSGIALMCHMIEADVPGYYVFFRGEECGGIGSKWLAKHKPELFALFDRAVAFDRAGYSDVITHQGMGRCCSDAWANLLADALNDHGLLYMPDDTGVYTDTAEFVDLVSECTNLSVGYKHQHGDREEQDLTHLVAMATALVQIDWDGLTASRDPAVIDDKWSSWDTGNKRDNKWSAKWDSASPATTTTKMSYVADDEDADQDFDADLEHEELYQELIEAYAGKFTGLISLIAYHLGVNDTACVASTLNTNSIDSDAIDHYLAQLDDGWYAKQVAEAIYDEHYRV